MYGRPSRRSGWGQEAHPKVRKAHQGAWEGLPSLTVPPGEPSHTLGWRCIRGREGLPEVWEGL